MIKYITFIILTLILLTYSIVNVNSQITNTTYGYGYGNYNITNRLVNAITTTYTTRYTNWMIFSSNGQPRNTVNERGEVFEVIHADIYWEQRIMPIILETNKIKRLYRTTTIEILP